INLMRGIGRGRTRASEMILQLLFKRWIGPNLPRRLGTISDEIGDMSQRIEHALDTDTYCFGWVSHDKSGNDLLPSLLGEGKIFQVGLSIDGIKKDQSNFLERGIGAEKLLNSLGRLLRGFVQRIAIDAGRDRREGDCLQPVLSSESE